MADIDDYSARELHRMRRKLDQGIRGGPGVYVRNEPDGVVISVPQRKPVAVTPQEGRWAIVNSSTRLGSNWQWTYELSFVTKTSAGYGGWEAIAGVDTVTGYNTTEDINGATGLLGNGVTFANLPADFDPQPVPDDTPVFVRRVVVGDDVEWWFTHATVPDGEC